MLRVALPPGYQQRAYTAGMVNRLTQGWGSGIGAYSRSMDAETRYTLRVMRSRSRELYQNNDYFKKFVKLGVKNIVGPAGINFQIKAKDPDGTLDTQANSLIKTAFAAWCKKGVCDVTGKLSFAAAQRLFIQTIIVDGEVLVRKVRGFDNPYKFALQFIEADHLDENYNYVLENGNEIRMGVEFDKWDRPVAYHILVKHPGDYTYQRAGNRYEVVPAADMIHAFIAERPRQTRGIPWGHTAMTRLNNLGGYEEAAIVSKRISASKMGFIVPPVDDEGGYEGDEKTEDDDIVNEVEPGLLEILPAGYDFKQFAPAEPGGDYEPFMKRTLKGISSGMDACYHKIASDLEGVNYTSSRAGELDERDTWRTIQSWMIEAFNDDVFPAWLDVQLLYGKTLVTANGVPLPYAKYDKFNAAVWRPRGWDWTDPLKDMIANEKGLANKVNTRTRILAEMGIDLEEIYAELAHEKELAKKYGLEVLDPLPQGQTVRLPVEPAGAREGTQTKEPSGTSGAGEEGSK